MALEDINNLLNLKSKRKTQTSIKCIKDDTMMGENDQTLRNQLQHEDIPEEKDAKYLFHKFNYKSFP